MTDQSSILQDFLMGRNLGATPTQSCLPLRLVTEIFHSTSLGWWVKQNSLKPDQCQEDTTILTNEECYVRLGMSLESGQDSESISLGPASAKPNLDWELCGNIREIPRGIYSIPAVLAELHISSPIIVCEVQPRHPNKCF